MSEPTLISKLTLYIEENLRAAKNAGIRFVDPRGLRTRVYAKQNHIIFGRRGAGKTRLINGIEETSEFVTVYVNLEDAKDRDIAETARFICADLFEGLQVKLKAKQKMLNFRSRMLQKKLGRLTTLLRQPVTEESAKEQFDQLKRGIAEFKNLINEVSKELENKSIYLALDDFYFVPREKQAQLLDFFHRLTKDTELFLKVATIRDRSDLYKSDGSEYVGMEMGHDAQEVDMDYTLAKFDELETFLRELLTAASRGSGANLDPDTFFKDEGFKQLCIASEGVPREFLALFVKATNKRGELCREFIGREEVIALLDPEKTKELPTLEMSLPGEKPKREHFGQKLVRFFREKIWKSKKPSDE